MLGLFRRPENVSWLAPSINFQKKGWGECDYLGSVQLNVGVWLVVLSELTLPV